MLLNTGAVERGARVLCTGHSLGGALAMLAALEIAADARLRPLQVWCLGHSLVLAGGRILLIAASLSGCRTLSQWYFLAHWLQVLSSNLLPEGGCSPYQKLTQRVNLP